MHHKFLVVDFNTENARVYMGSYNFSGVADQKNGENLLVIKDRKIATSYMIEALRIFDHFEFRLAQAKASSKKEKLELKLAPADDKQETACGKTQRLDIFDGRGWFVGLVRDSRRRQQGNLEAPLLYSQGMHRRRDPQRLCRLDSGG